VSAQRAERSDKGEIRLTERDVEVMTFVADHYGIRKDQLVRLVGDVSERTIRALIDRWVRGGLVGRRTIFAGDHAWLWPTRAGLDLVPVRLPYWEPRPGILDHVYWVTETRFRVAARHPDSRWISERRLRAEAGGANRPEHMPDGIVVKGERKIAIEVQLAHKSHDRSIASLESLTGTYDGVWVFARAGGPFTAALRAAESAYFLWRDHDRSRPRLLPSRRTSDKDRSRGLRRQQTTCDPGIDRARHAHRLGTCVDRRRRHGRIPSLARMASRSCSEGETDRNGRRTSSRPRRDECDAWFR
jgi:hypothetical protein